MARGRKAAKKKLPEQLSEDAGLIALAANSMSCPLDEVHPGVVLIKTDAAQAILDRARELGGDQ